MDWDRYIAGPGFDNFYGGISGFGLTHILKRAKCYQIQPETAQIPTINHLPTHLHHPNHKNGLKRPLRTLK